MAYAAEVEASRDVTLLDLNRGFRTYLSSRAMTEEVAHVARRTHRALEQCERLQGSKAWALQRSVYLTALVALLHDNPQKALESECWEAYFHYLATGSDWYFRRHLAEPHTDGDTFTAEGVLGYIGDLFAQYLAGTELFELATRHPRIVVCIEDGSQLPFAVVVIKALSAQVPTARVELQAEPVVEPAFLRLFAARVRPDLCMPEPVYPAATITPLLKPTEIAHVAHWFRRSRDRLLRVSWQPSSGRTRKLGVKLHQYLTALREQKVPVALLCSPWIDADTSEVDAFLFETLDKLLELQSLVEEITLSVRSTALVKAPLCDLTALRRRDRERSDLLRVQLEAELDNVRLVPHRARRKQITPRTRLIASPAYVIRSHFDLAAISEALIPGVEARYYTFGRGRPLSDTPVFMRSATPRDYWVFSGCPRVIPISQEDASYADALAFFKTPTSVGEFLSDYGDEDRDRALAFLNVLVHNEILRCL